MLLNFEKFENYSSEFSFYMGVVNGRIDSYIDNLEEYPNEDEIKYIIHEQFPKNWIIFGKYSTSNKICPKQNYYHVSDLSIDSLENLHNHITQIEVMCDDSYQTLQDFDQFDITGL